MFHKLEIVIKTQLSQGGGRRRRTQILAAFVRKSFKHEDSLVFVPSQNSASLCNATIAAELQFQFHKRVVSLGTTADTYCPIQLHLT